MKLAAVVITYNPPGEFVANLLSYSASLPKVYVLDNSEKPNDLRQLLSSFDNVFYKAYMNNEGIGKRLNEGAALAVQDGFTHLLTMDQDSSFSPSVFAHYLQLVQGHEAGEPGKTGVYAVNFQPQFSPVVAGPQKVLSTITSGSVISLLAHAAVEGYNEGLFLDLVDADFCFRVNRAGYDIILFSEIILNHTIGESTPGRSFKNFKMTDRKIHSPVRIYYLIRNSLWMLKHSKPSAGERSEILNNLKLLKNNFLYHPQKRQVMKYFMQGIRDFRRGRLGKYKAY